MVSHGHLTLLSIKLQRKVQLYFTVNVDPLSDYEVKDECSALLNMVKLQVGDSSSDDDSDSSSSSVYASARSSPQRRDPSLTNVLGASADGGIGPGVVDHRLSLTPRPLIQVVGGGDGVAG